MFSLYANWKSNKNIVGARAWFSTFRETLTSESQKLLKNGQMEVVIFPPAPLIYPLHTLRIDVPGVSVGIQDISPFGEGPYTGLVSATSVEGIVTHAIVGHAEERERGDTDSIVGSKYERAVASKLFPILCISHPSQVLPGAQIVAYEPLDAIGSGNNAPPDAVVSFAQGLAHKPTQFIYGGSVSAGNCAQYLRPRICDGFLVGKISLDPLDFASLVNTCASYVSD